MISKCMLSVDMLPVDMLSMHMLSVDMLPVDMLPVDILSVDMLFVYCDAELRAVVTMSMTKYTSHHVVCPFAAFHTKNSCAATSSKNSVLAQRMTPANAMKNSRVFD